MSQWRDDLPPPFEMAISWDFAGPGMVLAAS